MPPLYDKPFYSHNKFHKNVQQMHGQPQFHFLRNPILNEMTNAVSFKNSQAFTSCINFSLKFFNIS